MHGRPIDPDLLRAGRTGLFLGLWVTALGLVCYVVLGGPQFGLDSHAYWLALHKEHPYGAEPHAADAYLYSPLFLQIFRPLGILPWPTFVAVWATIQIVTVWWLLRPLSLAWRIPLMLLCVPEFILGNVHALMALSLVLGFSRPGWWAVLPLTKVEPGGPLALWLAAAGQWRRLASWALWTGALTAVSVLTAPALWAEWFAFLIRPHDIDQALWVRLAVSLILVVVAARRRWIWALPIAVLLSIPTDGLGISGVVLMTATPRLIRHADRRTDGWAGGATRADAYA